MWMPLMMCVSLTHIFWINHLFEYRIDGSDAYTIENQVPIWIHVMTDLIASHSFYHKNSLWNSKIDQYQRSVSDFHVKSIESFVLVVLNMNFNVLHGWPSFFFATITIIILFNMLKNVDAHRFKREQFAIHQ